MSLRHYYDCLAQLIKEGIDMNARIRRLNADFNKIKDEFYGHKYVKVEPLEGNPPVRYLVTYYLTGLKFDLSKNRPVETYYHQVEIYLHKNYPREKPQCTIKTEIFHPNFGPTKVCIADHWAAGESIADIIVQIGQMIQYQNYNPKSPLNQKAARWTIKNENLFPLGSIDLYQAEPDIDYYEDKNKDLEDDLDIELF